MTLRKGEEILKVAGARFAGQGPFRITLGAVEMAQAEAIERAAAIAGNWGGETADAICIAIRNLLPSGKGD
jgi:hypothetical protein